MTSERFERDFEEALSKYLRELTGANYQEKTVERIKASAAEFLRFLGKSDGTLGTLKDLGKAQLYAYRDFLPDRKTQRGRKLSISVVRVYLGALRGLLRYFHAMDILPKDLSVHVGRLPLPDALPRYVPTVEEVGRLLKLPKRNLKGRRDQAILELLYGSGIRRAEAAALDTYDLDFVEKTILIRKGKGARERKVPMGEHLAKVLEEYLKTYRPLLLWKNEEENALFLNHTTGGRLAVTQLGYLVMDYLKAAGLRGGPHVLRHAFATHLLKNGANIFYIQRLLGHKTLDTTDIYTRVYPVDLLKAVGEYHPRSHEAIPNLAMPIRRSNVRLPYLLKLQAEGKELDPRIYTYEKLAPRSREGL